MYRLSTEDKNDHKRLLCHIIELIWGFTEEKAATSVEKSVLSPR